MGGGKEIILDEGNRAMEIEGGYRRCTGVMWKDAEKRQGHSRWLSVKWGWGGCYHQWKRPCIPTTLTLSLKTNSILLQLKTSYLL